MVVVGSVWSRGPVWAGWLPCRRGASRTWPPPTALGDDLRGQCVPWASVIMDLAVAVFRGLATLAAVVILAWLVLKNRKAAPGGGAGLALLTVVVLGPWCSRGTCCGRCPSGGGGNGVPVAARHSAAHSRADAARRGRYQRHQTHCSSSGTALGLLLVAGPRVIVRASPRSGSPARGSRVIRARARRSSGSGPLRPDGHHRSTGLRLSARRPNGTAGSGPGSARPRAGR